jgi:hypothetical protein
VPPTLHLHVGPHFSGSGSINHCLLSLKQQEVGSDFIALRASEFSKLAYHLVNKNVRDAQIVLGSIRDGLLGLPKSVALASCEDLCGMIPAATGRKKVYPDLFENLQLISNTLKPLDCTFYFFRRDRVSWARDVYVHHLKENRRYLRFERFWDLNRIDEAWDLVLKKCRNRLGSSFVELDLEVGARDDPAQKFLSAAAGFKASRSSVEWRTDTPIGVIERLEQFNRASGSSFAIARAKYAELGVGVDRLADESSLGLEGLADRTRARIQQQTVSWILPELRFPLVSAWEKIIPEEDASFPEVTRVTMEGQARILRFRMRGLPEPCFLLGVLISYLRRDTIFTEKALELFFGMWRHEFLNLLAFLPTRWLISSLQTFLDHGQSEEQRIIGASGYFFANVLKAYEAERALEGSEVDKTYAYTIPQTEKLSGFGLDRFSLGRTDLLVNTLSMLYEVSLLDETAGRVAREFLLRVKSGHTIFSRMDQSRIVHNVDAKGFLDCWSFYRDPRIEDKKAD